MSIKTFPGGPERDPSQISVFLALSVFLHIFLALGLLTLGPVADLVMNRIIPKPKEPVVVDVIELPPAPDKPADAAPKKPPTHFADRTRSVEKETYPEPSRASRLVPGSPAVKPVTPGNKVPSAAKEARITKKEGASTERKAPAPLIPGEETYPDESKRGPEKKEALASEKVQENASSEAPKPGANEKAVTGTEQPGRPSLFPTEERLAELEKRYEAEAPRGEKGKTLQLNTSELRYQKYLINMKNRIEFYWEFPEVAARNGWQGTVRIDFSISKNGQVDSIKVVKSSNYPVLDEAAVTAIRLAAPFPPFPENFLIEQLNIKGSFEYSIYRAGGR